MRFDLITISREYGAGASELAALLGERLDWRVFDAQIPAAVAGRLRIPEASLEEWDEHAPGLLEGIGDSLMLGNPQLMFDAAYVRRPQARDVAAATRALLQEAAADPPVIIVGHGAQVQFRERPTALHLRLVAPIGVRCRRIMARRGCSEQDASAIARYVDRDRMHYVQLFHNHDVRDPLLYALQINTGVIDMPDAVALVLRVVQAADA
jgi:hypothetical protein